MTAGYLWNFWTLWGFAIAPMTQPVLYYWVAEVVVSHDRRGYLHLEDY